MIDRRQLVGGATLLSLLGGTATANTRVLFPWGSVGRIKARPGQRAELATLVLSCTDALLGCLSYVVAEDLGDPDALWVFESWREKGAHDLSLQLPAVREAIAKARPLIAGFDSGAELRIVGGIGSGAR